jgi:hypothetical protein
MWWIIGVVAFVAMLGFFEWRSRNKPLSSAFTNGDLAGPLAPTWGLGDDAPPDRGDANR